MSDTKAMQRLCGLMRKAVQQYEMLAPGDRVLVGVSGGTSHKGTYISCDG